MILKVLPLVGNEVLSGAQNGRRLLSTLIAETSGVERGKVVFLDFAGVSVATSSFLRESVVKFRTYASAANPPFYVVVANAGDAVIEELAFYLSETGDAIWRCTLKNSRPVHAEVIGKLDPAEVETLKLVEGRSEVTAPALAAQTGERIGATAWNNRLVSLASKGILSEIRAGRAKAYSSVMRNI